jgi:hypothetical protein
MFWSTYRCRLYCGTIGEHMTAPATEPESYIRLRHYVSFLLWCTHPSKVLIHAQSSDPCDRLLPPELSSRGSPCWASCSCFTQLIDQSLFNVGEDMLHVAIIVQCILRQGTGQKSSRLLLSDSARIMYHPVDSYVSYKQDSKQHHTRDSNPYHRMYQ